MKYSKQQVREMAAKVRGLVEDYRGRGLVVTAAMVAGVASAQTTNGPGETAVSGLGLESMIQEFANAVRKLVADNSLELMLVALPIMAWYFIRNNLRGSV